MSDHKCSLRRTRAVLPTAAVKGKGEIGMQHKVVKHNNFEGRKLLSNRKYVHVV